MTDERWETLKQLIDAGEHDPVLDFLSNEGLNINAKGGRGEISALHHASRKSSNLC